METGRIDLKTTIAEVIGSNLKNYLLERHISVDYLVQHSGISRRTLYRCFRGDYMPSSITITEVCHLLNINELDLIKI